MRIVLFSGVLSLVAILTIAFCGGYLRRPELLAKDQRTSKYGTNREFGYSVERFRSRPYGFVVTIWAGRTLQLRLNVERLELVRVKKAAWLAHDRAVVLEFDEIYHDSMDNPSESGLLYDFEKGELHSYGGSWHAWGPEGRKFRWLSAEEFHKIVDELAVVK